MKKVLLFCLLLNVAGYSGWIGAGSGSLNYNGFGDTVDVRTFRADSVRFTPAFDLSKWENLRITLMMNDTAAAGFASDSIKAIWGIQTGRVVYNGSGVLDTAWEPIRLIADTFDLVTEKTIGPAYALISAADGSYSEVHSLVDTSTVTGFAVQSKAISPAWDVLGRCWLIGVAGNKKASFIKTRFVLSRRVYTNTRGQ